MGKWLGTLTVGAVQVALALFAVFAFMFSLAGAIFVALNDFEVRGFVAFLVGVVFVLLLGALVALEVLDRRSRRSKNDT